MRKAEREIKDIKEILDVLDRCDTLRLGISGDEFPYIVPISFGYDYDGDKIRIYFHGAKQGLKHELIAKNAKVCIEGDIFHGYAKTQHSYTTQYESIIGFGNAKQAIGETEIKGLELILSHCGAEGYDARKCAELKITKVYEITLESITGKRRFV